MKSIILNVFFVALFVTHNALAENNRAGKLKFSFYITSACSDTLDFLTLSFYPVYQEFKDVMDVEFIPWGKTVRNPNNGTLTCQFGPVDCAANRLQNCALFQIGDDQNAAVEYMNCEFTTLASILQDYECVRAVGLTEGVTKQCVNSLLGDELEGLAELKTWQIPIDFVPTIVYNDKYDPKNQIEAFENFRSFVCSKLQESDPTACR